MMKITTFMKTFLLGCTSLVGTFILIDSSLADLKAPIDLSSARVLPQGVRNVRYKGMFIDGTDRYNQNADAVILADPFFKKISIRDILDPKTEPFKKGLLEGYLRANNWDLGELLGESTGDINIEATAQIPVFAYGLSPKLTIAVAVPVVQYDYNVETSFATGEGFERLAQKLKSENKTAVLTELRDKLKDPVGTKLKDFNYEPLKNEKGTKLGDVKIVSKYLLSQKPEYAFSVQNELTLPTGEEANINKLVDIPGGEGQTDIGFSFLTDWYVTENLTLSNLVNYTWQVKDKLARRVPYMSDSPISPDVDQSVARDLGDQIQAQLGARYDLPQAPGLFANTAYTFQSKERDRFAGYQYEPARYEWMEAKTRQRMQTMQFGLGYSTIKMFQQKRFPAPLEASLSYTRLLDGKNVTKDPVTSFELSMFF